MNKYVHIFLVASFAIASSSQTSAQDINAAVLSWKASSVKETGSAVFSANPGSIVTFQMTRAEVRDKSGTVLKSYMLSNPVGQLNDPNHDGRIRYRAVGSDGKPGVFLIDRRQGTTHILISFQRDGTLPKEHTYEISSVDVVE